MCYLILFLIVSENLELKAKSENSHCLKKVDLIFWKIRAHEFAHFLFSLYTFFSLFYNFSKSSSLLNNIPVNFKCQLANCSKYNNGHLSIKDIQTKLQENTSAASLRYAICLHYTTYWYTIYKRSPKFFATKQ